MKAIEIKNKTISIAEYINKIRSYLRDINNYLQKTDALKIQLKNSN